MEATIKLLRPFPKQYDILADTTRFKVLAIGRQWGKSELAVIDGVHRLLDGQQMWYCSPTNKNNKRMYPKFKAALSPYPGVYTNDSDMLVKLPTEAYIQFVSLEVPDNLRGAGLDHIYIDEAAFIKVNVFDNVLRPMLAARKGSAWFMSSPNGRNEFWQWTQRGLDPTKEDWQSWHLPSHTSPVLDNSELDDIQRNTPQRVFSQEYLAEFLEDGGAVFRNLQACTYDTLEIPQHTKVYFGVDWGKVNDYTVITAIDAISHRVLDIDRFNQIDWVLQRGRLIAMYERWKPEVIWAEQNSIGDPNIDTLRNEGLPMRGFQTTASSKSGLINSLALAFEQNDIGIPNNPTLLGELQAYTVEKLPSGTYRYTAPSGLHDDMVISLALAWHGIMQPTIRPAKVPDYWKDFDGRA